MTIQTNEDLERWLSDNYFFEDGHVLKIETNPLRIQVGYNIEGNYEANSVRVIRAFTLQPDQIIDWTLPDNSEFVASVDRYIEFIENIEASPNIGLLFCTPLSFRLVTNSFTVTENELINTVFKPWISHDENLRHGQPGRYSKTWILGRQNEMSRTRDRIQILRRRS